MTRDEAELKERIEDAVQRVFGLSPGRVKAGDIGTEILGAIGYYAEKYGHGTRSKTRDETLEKILAITACDIDRDDDPSGDYARAVEEANAILDTIRLEEMGEGLGSFLKEVASGPCDRCGSTTKPTVQTILNLCIECDAALNYELMLRRQFSKTDASRSSALDHTARRG